MRHVAGDRVEAGADEPPDVVLEFRLGHPRGLEIELVEDGIVGLRHDRGRPLQPTRCIGHAEADHAAKAVGAHQRGTPRHRCAPIVAGDDRLLGAERIEQPDHVADQVEERVLVDRLRPVGPAVTAHVGGHGMEPRLGECRELMAPGIPGFGKAVAQEDERPRTGFGEVHADAIGLDGAMRHFGRHGLDSHAGIPAIDWDRRPGHEFRGGCG
jgi:hypothetical protein